MKTISYTILITLLVFAFACDEEETPGKAPFKDVLEHSIYDYLNLEEHNNCYSSFITMVDVSGLRHTLSAYNPYNSGYTLFLPDNDAIDDFISANPKFSSLDELVADKEYTKTLCEYHIVDMKIETNSFPFGAFPEPTLSEDYLTVSFVIEEDSSYYKINNEAIVFDPNIELSNGYVHHIKSVLSPVVYTTYNWLAQNPEFSIFTDAVEMTGIMSLIDFNMKENKDRLPVTLLVEPDSVYHKMGIYSINDLIDHLQVADQEYQKTTNKLYGFVAYHLLNNDYYIDDFIDVNTVYETFSELPLNINGKGFDIAINKGKEVFDTIVNGVDTSYVDFIGFIYDESNIQTQSGPVHIINWVMTQKIPGRSQVNFVFGEEPLFNEYRKLGGEFIVDALLTTLKWSGTDLVFVRIASGNHPAWNNDFIVVDGDFTITYQLGKIIPGKYQVLLRAESFSEENATVEVFIDGKKIGNAIDLTAGSNANYRYLDNKLGTIDFKSYTGHVVEVRALIPGIFEWDGIIFKPI